MNIKKHPVWLVLESFIQAFSLLKQPGIKQFLILPVLINLVIYTLAFYFGFNALTDWSNSLIPTWLSWIDWLLFPVIASLFFVTGIFTFTLLANLVASPFYGQLSHYILKRIHTSDHSPSALSWQSSLTSEFRKMTYIVIRLIPLLILFVIPGINLVAPFFWALFACWGMAMEFLAYPMDEYSYTFEEQKIILRQNRTGTLVFGAIIAIGMTIPLVNLIAGQFAVISASLYIKKLRTLNPS
jgi:CysZ protein